jgi:hypothetical protein
MKKRKKPSDGKETSTKEGQKVSTISCSLKGIISPFVDQEKFIGIIDRLVVALARLRHEASL